MPFTKVGPDKYRGPSGKTFTKAQVALYYARGGTFKTSEEAPMPEKRAFDKDEGGHGSYPRGSSGGTSKSVRVTTGPQAPRSEPPRPASIRDDPDKPYAVWAHKDNGSQSRVSIHADKASARSAAAEHANKSGLTTTVKDRLTGARIHVSYPGQQHAETGGKTRFDKDEYGHGSHPRGAVAQASTVKSEADHHVVKVSVNNPDGSRVEHTVSVSRAARPSAASAEHEALEHVTRGRGEGTRTVGRVRVGRPDEYFKRTKTVEPSVAAAARRLAPSTPYEARRMQQRAFGKGASR